MRAAREAVRDERGPLRRCLRHVGKPLPLQHAGGPQGAGPLAHGVLHRPHLGQPPGEDELGWRGDGEGERRGVFCDALDERVPGDALGRRGWRAEPLRRRARVVPARYGGGSAGEQHRLRHAAREERALAVQRPRRAEPQRTRGTADAVHDLAASDRDHGGEGAAQLEQHERYLGDRSRATFGLLGDGERRPAHPVRRAPVHTIHPAVRRGGRKRLVEKYAAVLEAAHIDGDRPRVDADHAGHAPYCCVAANSRATSAMVSASSTRSLRSNRRATHALCTFIFRLPMASAPKHRTPSFVTPSSIGSTPSTPRGGTAFTSAMTFKRGRFAHACFGTSITPAGPALSTSSASLHARPASAASGIVTARTVPPNRFATRSRARSPASALREVMITSAPALANKPAARIPTGPVPATISTRLPRTSPAACSIFATAATAVVFDTFESSISDTVNGPKNACVAAASSTSPTAMLDRKSTRLNSSHGYISYAVFCLKKKKTIKELRMLSM